MLHMRQIPRPDWARLSYSSQDAPPQVIAAIQAHWDDILSLIHQAVEEYVNDDNLCFTDGKNFPDRNRLTGEYYLRDESFEWYAEDEMCNISLTVCCLEYPWLPNMVETNYLGFLMGLYCSASGWPCEVTSMDSASI